MYAKITKVEMRHLYEQNQLYLEYVTRTTRTRTRTTTRTTTTFKLIERDARVENLLQQMSHPLILQEIQYFSFFT